MSQPKGSVSRASNVVWTRRGGLKVCDGTRIITQLDTGLAGSGGGDAGTFLVSPSAMNFGSVPANTAAQMLIELTYQGGTISATVISVSLSNSQFSLVQMPALPLTLAPDGFTGWYVQVNRPAGSYSAVLTIVTSLGTVTVPVTAMVVTGSVVVSPVQLTFPSTAAGATSAAQTISVTNNEPAQVDLGGYTIESAPFTPSTDFAFSPVPPFPQTIAPGQTLTFSVVATPQSAGAKQATLTILTNLSGVQMQVTLTVTALAALSQLPPTPRAAGFSVSTTSVDFGSVPANTTVTLPVTISFSDPTGVNPGQWTGAGFSNTEFTLSLVGVPTPFPINFVDGTAYTFHIAVNVAVAGTDTAVLTLYTFNPTGTIAINVTATIRPGTAPPPLSFSVAPSPINFGNVPENAVTTIPVTVSYNDPGGVPTVNWTGLSLSNSDFYLTSYPPSFPVVMTSGQKIIFQVNINQPLGTYSAVMTLTTDIGTYTVSISAGTVVGFINISPASLDFGTQPVLEPSTPQEIQIANYMGLVVLIGTPVFSNPDFYFTNSPQLPYAIGETQVLVLDVGVTPSVGGGQTESATLTLTTDNSNYPHLVIPLTVVGTGTAPQPAVPDYGPITEIFLYQPSGAAAAYYGIVKTPTSCELVEFVTPTYSASGNIVHTFPPDVLPRPGGGLPGAHGGSGSPPPPPSGGSGGTPAGVSGFEPPTANGGIPGQLGPLPLILQFVNKMLLALGNGYPPYESDGTVAGTTQLTNTFSAVYPNWLPSTVFAAGDQVQIQEVNCVFTATQGGTSGTAPPNFFSASQTNQTVSDNNIIWKNTSPLTGSPAPPGAAHAEVYAGSYWVWNTWPTMTTDQLDGPSALRMSTLNNPNSWNPLNAAQIEPDDGDQGNGLKAFTVSEAGIAPQNFLVVFKFFSTYLIKGVFGSGDFAITRLQTDLGCVASRTIQFLPGYGIMRLTHLGFAVTDGITDKLQDPEAIRPYLLPEATEMDIAPIDQTYLYFSKGAQTANPPMYVCAVPVILSGQPLDGQLTRLFCYDLVLKVWTIIDLPFAISAMKQFRTPGSQPITVMAGFRDGALRRWQAGDTEWDAGAPNVGVPTIVHWGFTDAEVHTQGATVRMFHNQVIIRGDGGPPSIVVTPTINGYVQASIRAAMIALGDGQFEARVRLLETAQNLSLEVAGMGPAVIESIDYNVQPKPAGAALVFS